MSEEHPAPLAGFDARMLRLDTYTNERAEVGITVTHIPTGVQRSAIAHGSLRARRLACEALRDALKGTKWAPR